MELPKDMGGFLAIIYGFFALAWTILIILELAGIKNIKMYTNTNRTNRIISYNIVSMVEFFIWGSMLIYNYFGIGAGETLNSVIGDGINSKMLSFMFFIISLVFLITELVIVKDNCSLYKFGLSEASIRSVMTLISFIVVLKANKDNVEKRDRNMVFISLVLSILHFAIILKTGKEECVQKTETTEETAETEEGFLGNLFGINNKRKKSTFANSNCGLEPATSDIAAYNSWKKCVEQQSNFGNVGKKSTFSSGVDCSQTPDSSDQIAYRQWEKQCSNFNNVGASIEKYHNWKKRVENKGGRVEGFGQQVDPVCLDGSGALASGSCLSGMLPISRSNLHQVKIQAPVGEVDISEQIATESSLFPKVSSGVEKAGYDIRGTPDVALSTAPVTLSTQAVI
jgi:hypothetical protein